MLGARGRAVVISLLQNNLNHYFIAKGKQTREDGEGRGREWLNRNEQAVWSAQWLAMGH